MEEILASIRRIIADDQDSLRPAEGEPEQEPEHNWAYQSAAASSLDDHLSSGDSEGAVAPTPPESQTEPAEDLDLDVPEILFSEVARREPEQPRIPKPDLHSAATPAPERNWSPPPRAEPRASEALISNEATAHVGSAFNMLSQTVLAQNARTLEDLVQELLKPMLKTWLDDNLPPLVERLVRAEIERVARGRG